MRGAAYILLGVLLTLIQSTLFRLWGPLMSVTIFGERLGSLFQGATPNLVLPLVIYLGVNELSMARGAFLSFGLGWVVDILGGGPAFLFRFTMVGVWWLAHAVSSRVSAQSLASRILVAFVASLLESFTILTLLAIFGSDSQRPLDLAPQVAPRAVSTALLSPFVFSLAHRLQLDSRPAQSASSGGAG